MGISALAKSGLNEDVVSVLKQVVNKVPWPERRLAKADVVIKLLDGKARLAESIFGWARGSIEIGISERLTGKRHIGNIENRKKPSTEEKFPNIERDIRSLFDEQSQADSRLGTTLRYLNASASNVREALIGLGYSEDELPTTRTISNLLNRMGFRLRSVQKAKPQKKLEKQT